MTKIKQHGPRPGGDAPEEYDRLREPGRFVESVHEGLADAEAGRVLTDEELAVRLDDVFGPLEEDEAPPDPTGRAAVRRVIASACNATASSWGCHPSDPEGCAPG